MALCGEQYPEGFYYHRLFNFSTRSPDGFDWGGEDGSDDLALSILRQVYKSKNKADSLKDEFQKEFVNKFENEWTISKAEVKEWASALV